MKFIAIFSFFLLASPIANAKSLNCKSNQGQYYLESGERIELPLCFPNSTMRGLTALANLKKVNAYLKDYGYHALPYEGKALIQIGSYDHADSTLGPYREFSIATLGAPLGKVPCKGLACTLAQTPSFPFNVVYGSDHEFGTIIMKLWIGGDDLESKNRAIVSGNEIWGFRKEGAKITLRQAGGIEPSISLDLEDGTPVFASVWSKEPRGAAYGVLRRLDFRGQFISLGNNFRTSRWALSESRGDADFSRVDRAKIISGWNPDTEWGARMQSFELDYQFYLKSDSYEGAFHGP